MLIWDIIRDWFVKYVFGGCTSNNEIISVIVGYDANEDTIYDTASVNITKLTTIGGLDYKITLGDWLSSTATLIVIIAILFGLFMLVRYFFRMFSGLLTFR